MIKTIRAVMQGPLVGTLKGNLKVVSLFGSVINLVTEKRLLLSLVKNEGLMSGFAILTPDLFGSEMKSIRKQIKVEIGGILSDTVLRLLMKDSEVLVDLEGAKVWSGRISAIVTKYRVDNPKELVEDLKGFLLVHGKKGGFLDVKENHFLYYAKKLLTKKITDQSSERTIDLSDLIGLGIGFTPSGDDFITGCIVAEELAKVYINEQSSCDRNELFVIDRKKLKASLSKTNDGGRSLLYQVLEGIYPSYILDFVRSIGLSQQYPDKDKNKEIVEDAVKEMVLHGETSGTDTLTGFVWYFNHLVFL